MLFSFFCAVQAIREGTGGVAGGRGHPDLTGSAKPGMPAALTPPFSAFS